jgi:hypothetical protein
MFGEDPRIRYRLVVSVDWRGPGRSQASGSVGPANDSSSGPERRRLSQLAGDRGRRLEHERTDQERRCPGFTISGAQKIGAFRSVGILVTCGATAVCVAGCRWRFRIGRVMMSAWAAPGTARRGRLPRDVVMPGRDAETEAGEARA